MEQSEKTSKRQNVSESMSQSVEKSIRVTPVTRTFLIPPIEQLDGVGVKLCPQLRGVSDSRVNIAIKGQGDADICQRANEGGGSHPGGVVSVFGQQAHFASPAFVSIPDYRVIRGDRSRDIMGRAAVYPNRRAPSPANQNALL